ncbi:MAG: hypothetical protein MJ153_09270 [Clostridia bacterium]|nr:hypothetical protein [Clostridia bacterium]
MNKSFKIILIIVMSIIVGGAVLVVQLLYPRFEHSYKEIDEIYAENFVEGEYVRVKVSGEDKKKVYEIIKHSWINVDFLAGDNCGPDGPGILIYYNDGTCDSWICTERDHTCYVSYNDRWGWTSEAFNSKELLCIIESYTEN